MAIPIPHQPSGFLLGYPAAKVTIDAFVDIQCPHSKRAWPTLLQLLEHYKNDSVSLRVHLITLSNHRQAWDMSLGLFALADGDAQRFFDFATYMYERQDQYYNGQFADKTHNDLRNLVANFAEQHAAVNPDEFLKEMGEHDVYINARTPIRFAATRAVWATPTLFINNGDNVPVNHESTLEEWRAVIDPLL